MHHSAGGILGTSQVVFKVCSPSSTKIVAAAHIDHQIRQRKCGGPHIHFYVTNPPDPLRVKVYGPEFFKGWCRPTDCASEGPKGALNVEMQRDSAQECTSIAIFQFCKLDIVTAWITKSVGPFNQGVIELLEEFTVCKTGDQLSADHARILKQFGHRLA
ncbi:hypothetical protein niasHT_033149 [Heterodera trifolii]|uniref:Uncharacterized protein n=1 Tax=Heterodera trifolii TaxID=157864 RepID=A0ABD2IWT4_9BILA